MHRKKIKRTFIREEEEETDPTKLIYNILADIDRGWIENDYVATSAPVEQDEPEQLNDWYSYWRHIKNNNSN